MHRRLERPGPVAVETTGAVSVADTRALAPATVLVTACTTEPACPAADDPVPEPTWDPAEAAGVPPDDPVTLPADAAGTLPADAAGAEWVPADTADVTVDVTAWTTEPACPAADDPVPEPTWDPAEAAGVPPDDPVTLPADAAGALPADAAGALPADAAGAEVPADTADVTEDVTACRADPACPAADDVVPEPAWDTPEAAWDTPPTACVPAEAACPSTEEREPAAPGLPAAAAEPAVTSDSPKAMPRAATTRPAAYQHSRRTIVTTPLATSGKVVRRAPYVQVRKMVESGRISARFGLIARSWADSAHRNFLLLTQGGQTGVPGPQQAGEPPDVRLTVCPDRRAASRMLAWTRFTVRGGRGPPCSPGGCPGHRPASHRGTPVTSPAAPGRGSYLGRACRCVSRLGLDLSGHPGSGPLRSPAAGDGCAFPVRRGPAGGVPRDPPWSGDLPRAAAAGAFRRGGRGAAPRRRQRRGRCRRADPPVRPGRPARRRGAALAGLPAPAHQGHATPRHHRRHGAGVRRDRDPRAAWQPPGQRRLLGGSW